VLENAAWQRLKTKHTIDRYFISQEEVPQCTVDPPAMGTIIQRTRKMLV
jgi:hypothetical protein